MTVDINTTDTLTVATLTGEIDGKTAPQAQAQLVPHLQGDKPLLLDMNAVPYMSSAGLRMMLLLYRQATAKNSRVALVGLSEDIKDTMSATGFLSYFVVADTLEEGRAALEATDG